MTKNFDVLIIGGALAGSSTAYLLAQKYPQLRILIIEKDLAFKRRVGESTVETSTYFLTKILGLGHYLNRYHISKQGLRFWFCNDNSKSIADCSEIGPGYNTRLASFQVDRSMLDEKVLNDSVEAGATLWRGAKVTNVELYEGGEQSASVLLKDGNNCQVKTRWIVDASGVSAKLARGNGWLENLQAHPTNSLWCRFRNVKDLDELCAREQVCSKGFHTFRNTATNHLLGYGYWVWCIPLQDGDVSIGIVYDHKRIEIPKEGPIPERILAFVRKHPVGAALLKDAQAVEGDSNMRKRMPYRSKKLCGNGYVLCGDAAAFLDPFYSPGLDWLSFTVCNAVTLISESIEEKLEPERIKQLNSDANLSYQRWFEALYKNKYAYMGDYELMLIGFQVDLSFYYLGVVRGIWDRGWDGFQQLPFSHPNAKIPFKIMKLCNQRLAAIAESRRSRGCWGRANSKHKHKFNSYTLNNTLPIRALFALLRWWRLELIEGWHTWFTKKKNQGV